VLVLVAIRKKWALDESDSMTIWWYDSSRGTTRAARAVRLRSIRIVVGSVVQHRDSSAIAILLRRKVLLS